MTKPLLIRPGLLPRDRVLALCISAKVFAATDAVITEPPGVLGGATGEDEVEVVAAIDEGDETGTTLRCLNSED